MGLDAAQRLGDAPMWPCEDEIKSELAAAHVLGHEYNMSELVWNHITARASPTTNQFYISRFPVLWEFVTPDDIIGPVGSVTGTPGSTSAQEGDNETAHVIHGAVYAARPDVAAIFHCHTPAIEAASILAGDTLLATISGELFQDRIAWHEFDGISTDDAEQEAIAAAAAGDCHTLMMRNHGACTFGASVGQAFVRMYYLERVCAAALAALSTGQPLALDGLAEKMRRSREIAEASPKFAHGASEWPQLKLKAEILMMKRAAELESLAAYKAERESRSLREVPAPGAPGLKWFEKVHVPYHSTA